MLFPVDPEIDVMELAPNYLGSGQSKLVDVV